MCKVPVFVGLDYHQSGIQVCVMAEDGSVLTNQKVANRSSAVELVVRRYGEPESVALEACCGAANLADELAEKAGWSVRLAHPGYVARIKGSPDKTDYADARLLADLLRVGYLPVVWLAPEQVRQLRRLVRYRNQLVKDRRNAKLRIRALLREHRMRPPEGVNSWTKAWMQWLVSCSFSEDDRLIVDGQLNRIHSLKSEIRAAEARLKKRAADDAVIQKLMTLEGVGLITAATLRAEVGRFDRFSTGKQLARFCSVTPRNASSGERQADAGLVKAGSPLLRSVLIETAQRLMWRSDSQWAEFGTRLLARGKPKNVVVAAVANRWVRWLHHQLTIENLAA
jgi:transposase